MKKILSIATIVGALASGALHAQGILPPGKPSAAPRASATLLIGDRVTDALIVYDLQGSSRTLVSYKDALDVMVVEFLSARCPETQAQSLDWRHFYEAYKDWGVQFVAVESDSAEAPEDLVNALKQARISAGSSGIGVPVVRDPQGSLPRIFGIEKIPALVILDEGGNLRYRGPMGGAARQAIDAVISHQEPVDQAEPPVTAGCPIP
jgi:hypothetical protein